MAWLNTCILGEIVPVAEYQEYRDAIAMYEGIAVSAAPGVTITFSVAYGSVDAYTVEMAWQEAFSPTDGELRATKAVGSCVIRNSGTGYGKKFHYRVKKVITLP